MKNEIRFILKNKTEQFYNTILKMNGSELFIYLTKTMMLKYQLNGMDNFRMNDMLAMNEFMRSNKNFSNIEIQKRKGYNLLLLSF